MPCGGTALGEIAHLAEDNPFTPYFALHLTLGFYLRTFAGRKHTNTKELASTDKPHSSWPELAVAMATTNMASATSRFMLAAGMPTGGSSSNRVSFVSSNRLGRRLVVRAEEEPAAPPAPTPAAGDKAEGAVATKEPAKAKPPPIGPKRGTKVLARLLTLNMYVRARAARFFDELRHSWLNFCLLIYV